MGSVLAGGKADVRYELRGQEQVVGASGETVDAGREQELGVRRRNLAGGEL